MAIASPSFQAELVVLPHGHVSLDVSDRAAEQLPSDQFTLLSDLFAKSSAVGLLRLGVQEFAPPLPPSFHFWQRFVRLFIVEVCKQPNTANHPPPQEAILQDLLTRAPFMRGGEFLSVEALISVWQSLHGALAEEVTLFAGRVEGFLHEYNPRWNLVGRVCFHLAENKNDPHHPFAFLATYTTGLTLGQTPQHLPLKRALQEYAGDNNREGLLALLVPVQRAAVSSAFVRKMVDSGSLFSPQAWTASEAYQFLKAIPLFEESGIIVRVPQWWNAQKPPRPKISVTVGSSPPSIMGLDSLLDFQIHLALGDGQTLTQVELEQLLSSSDPMVKVKERWVEVDREKIRSVLAHWDQVKRASENGLSMAEALRLLSGAYLSAESEGGEEEIREWSAVHAGPGLKAILEQLTNPESSSSGRIEDVLQQRLVGTLRPYQLSGVKWLHLLYELKLGGCLADDMGLGKTIQVLSLLLIIKQRASSVPHLLVVPASLLGNWQAEIARFAPSLRIVVAHGSAGLLEARPENLAGVDLVITTYGFLVRSLWLRERQWDLAILDEAQTIKNPGTKQTKAVKALKARVRLILTGTPIENRLSDLWSLFDFTLPGLLGSSKAFTEYSKRADGSTDFLAAFRSLTRPYILRRLKNDKRIIADLPDKTEVHAFCSLSPEQVQLYQQSVEELMQRLESVKGIGRRGLVLSYLLRFKQICNHPHQWLGYGDYRGEASGKFIRLQELCEMIAAKQEKVLIFTQFREIMPAIGSLVTQVFGREGLFLDGHTPVRRRQELVSQFQQELGPPFFVLSLRAGGTGLNLTQASHVIHFDRWWNPAVENQATDRAYRIGQSQPVLVHKFVCRGTIEEKIDALIHSKTKLSEEVLSTDGEAMLTELSKDELFRLVSLDIRQALGET
jgi:hypothetical protein